MGVFRWFSWLMGFIQINIKGPAVEKFINMAISRGIYLWDIRRRKDGTISAKVRLNSFRPLRNIARKQDSSMAIEDKVGFPFWVRRARRRQAFFAGAALFAVALYVFSSFVWNVEVTGVEKVDPARILAAAEGLGLKQGVWKGSLDKKTIEKSLEQAIPELAWVGLQFRGTTVIIEVHERTLPPRQEYAGPAHLIAAKDGVIEEVLVMQGVAAVKKGDTVRKGQLLVSGLIFPPAPPADPKDPNSADLPPAEPPKRVQAKGTIKARIWYEAYGQSKLLDVGEEETGRVEEQLRMKILGKEIIMRGPERPGFEAFREEIEGSGPLGWRNLRLPVEVNKVRFAELAPYRREQNPQQAEAKAKEEAMAKIKGKLPPAATIMTSETTVIPTGDGNLVRVRVLVEALEEIGQVLPLQDAPAARRLNP